MKKFSLVAEVERLVVDTVLIQVKADTESEAYAIAHRTLAEFPKAHGEDGVDFCYIENREQLSAEVKHLRELEEGSIG